MSEMRSLLVETAGRLFNDLATNDHFEAAERGELARAAWQLVELAGLARATVPENLGGTGSDFGDALMLVREAGKHALPLPLADTLLAQRLLALAGLPAQDGVGTIGPVALRDQGAAAARGSLVLQRDGADWRLSGSLYRVPAARHADFLAALAEHEGQPVTVLIEGAAVRAALLRQDVNWANEPRDNLGFDRLRLSAAVVGQPGAGLTPEDLRFEGALFRLVAMSGALGRVLNLTVRYVQERVQFGKPLGNFQAVQHGVAQLAAQVAAANAAADAAMHAVELSGEGRLTDAARFAIAAAKTRIGEAAHIANGFAHQLHGAMGFTQEHALHRSTRRLWAWRDEFGDEAEWAAWVGRVAVRLGSAGLWPFLTARDKVLPGHRHQPD